MSCVLSGFGQCGQFEVGVGFFGVDVQGCGEGGLCVGVIVLIGECNIQIYVGS